ncbi:bacterial dolichol-phosphate mannose synthase-like protein [Candidatus Termititenax persephonae]|uniref:Bacterial dolichol-phosphate mannose synthase-like protein n=1 Tax=Candidatus Termititenax persephonae TaxID=2218525 RepID=A0A388TFJ0_9BACT|nr:bacterial dolichol-phosphate mannose synthase-like protein [Candidatus Termititenax persephonae]
MPNMLTLALVVPCYNEEEIFPQTAVKLAQKIRALQSARLVSKKSKVVFVDDGSQDKTWELIAEQHRRCPQIFSGIKLSKNRGHQNALLCGLLTVKDSCDAVISIDADMQDDITVIDGMVRQFLAGCEIVYGVRNNRQTDGLFKKITAQAFYKLMSLLGVQTIYNHADFRLMGRRALDALAEYGEVNLFLRGIIPLLGYKTGVEYYTRAKRLAGTSKYPFYKMLNFALEGITSLSIKPIRLITLLGILLLLVSLAMIVWSIYRYFSGHTIVGWASLAVSLWAIGGLIIFSIGVIGEYIGKIYLETKQRPRYIIEKLLNK